MHERATVTETLAGELRWFDAVARHEHLTRAADELGVEQSTISRALGRWERRLDVPLVSRTGGRVRLTPRGRALADVAARALRVIDEADEAVLGIQPVVLGFLNTLGPRAVPDLLRAWSAHRGPDTARITLRGGGTGELADGLRTGEIDLALTSPRPDGPDLAAADLFSEPLRLVVAPEHRLAAAARPVGLDEVADEPVLALPPGYGLRTVGEELWARAGLRPRIAFTSGDTATLRGLAAAGFGVVVLPPAADVPDAVELPLSDPAARRTIVLAWSTTRHVSDAVDAVRAYVRDHLTSDPRR